MGARTNCLGATLANIFFYPNVSRPRLCSGLAPGAAGASRRRPGTRLLPEAPELTEGAGERGGVAGACHTGSPMNTSTAFVLIQF